MSGGSAKPIQQAIANLIKEFKAGEGEQLSDGSRLILWDEHPFHVQIMQVGTRETVCFLGADIQKAGLLAESSRETLKAKRPSKAELKPGSEHLKRTGRSRNMPGE